jgi:membrane fusion protein (multidrug efflux system)
VPLMTACSSSAADSAPSTKAQPSGQPVETVRAGRGELTARYAATASLQAEQEAQLVTELPGMVIQILVEEGAVVRKGDVLARIDADRSRLQLREAEADLQRRKNEVDRGEKLLSRKLIAANTQDQATSDYEVRRAEVNLARLRVNKSEIRAPFDGVVTRRWIKQGQLLTAEARVFDVANFADLRAELKVPERDAVNLKAGQTVRFTVDAMSGRDFQATLERVAPTVDRASGTVNAIVRIDNRAGELRPGLFARMRIDYLHIDNAVLVPKTAVLGNRGAAVAYVIKDGKAHRTPIKLGHEGNAQVQVLEGLEPDAEVVVTGHAALSDGALVEVVPRPATAIVQAKSSSSTSAKRI